MTHRPTVPAVPDVFSTSHPSHATGSATVTSSALQSAPLSPAANAWVDAFGANRGEAQALGSPADDASNGGQRNERPERELSGAFPLFSASLVTPPASPVSWFVLGRDVLTPPPSREARISVSSSPSNTGHLDRSELSPLSPSFNPVVGSTSSTTPSRRNPSASTAQPFQSIFRFDHPGGGKSASDPTTPLRLSTLTGDPAVALSRDEISSAAPPSWTWPPRHNRVELGDARLRCHDPVASPPVSSPRRSEGDTPTKGVRLTASSYNEASHNCSSAIAPACTRYVLVQGLDADLGEAETRDRLLSRCASLSVRDCFMARLQVHGEAVLVFHDARHALAASRLISIAEAGETVLHSMCITRATFEMLAGPLQASQLLSTSEAVLVVTHRDPTAAPHFTPISLLAHFGDIRALKVVEEQLHVVEYWDDRSAERTFEMLSNHEQAGARFECSFEPAAASTDMPSWRNSCAIPAALSTATPTGPYLPTTPLASPRLSQPYTVTSACPSLTPVLAPVSGSALKADLEPTHGQARWPAPFQPVAPAGLLHFGPQQQPREQPSLRACVEPSHPSATASVASPRTPVAAAWPVKHRSQIGQDFGIVRDDRIPANNVLNFARIERGLDVRTTLMIKNIPNKLRDTEVMDFIDEIVGRAYDFFYLRCDYSTGSNVGYGFCNFTSTEALLAFAKARLGTRWNLCGSDKLCVLSYANIQGKESLINHFRNSSVLDQAEDRRPKLFVSSGPRAGQPESFPMCDDPLRKARSALNASSVGLFPAQRPVFKLAQAFQGLEMS